MKKKILGLLIAMMMAIPAFASLGVSPTRVEIDATKVRGNFITTAIEVRGDSNKPMRFKIYPEYFKISEKNEVVMIEKSNEPDDLTKKIRIVPAEFNVMPGKTQKVRLNVTNLNTLPDGESRTMLYIEDVNPKEYAVDTGKSGISAQLIVKTRMGIPVYLDKGNVQKHCEIEYLKIQKEKDGLYTEMKLVDKGNSKIRYTGKAQIIKDKNLVDEYDLTGGCVGHNNYFVHKQKIKLDGIKEQGEYTLRTVISYIDGKGKKVNLKEETNLVIENI